MIFRQGFTVRGLTTAASLWLVAAIGIAAGAGFWKGAVIATVAALVSLRPLEWVEGARRSRSARRRSMTVELAEGASAARCSTSLERSGDLLALRREGERLEIELRVDARPARPRAGRGRSAAAGRGGALGLRADPLLAQRAQARRARRRRSPAGRSSCSTRTATRRRRARRTTRTRAARRCYGRAVGPADAWVLGEDSGSRSTRSAASPGVHSARWADEGRQHRALLERARGRGRPPRPVRRELVAIAPDGREVDARRHARGRDRDRGARHERLRLRPGLRPRRARTRTVAELGDDWKRANSHRARAAAGAQRCARRQLTSAPKTITFAIT